MNAAELPGLFDLAPPPAVEEVLEVAWPENVDHVSASAFKTFAACPEQYRRRYLCGEIIPPSANLLWGRADHAAAEHNYVQKIETHADLPVGDIEELFASRVDAELEEVGGVNEMDWSSDKYEGIGVTGRKAELADLKDRGVKIAANYHLTIAPAIQPLAVEEEFSVRIPGVPVPIIGRLDLLAEPSEQIMAEHRTLAALAAMEGEGEPGDLLGRRLIDKKTSGSKKTSPEADWSIQAGIYQLAKWLPHEWHVSVKNKEKFYTDTGGTAPALLVKASSTRKRWIEKTLRGMVAELGWMYLTFGADEPWPASRAIFHQWRCLYCGYAKTCEWRRG